MNSFRPIMLPLILTLCGLCAALLTLTLLIGRTLPAERIIFLSDGEGPLQLYGMDIAHGIIHKLNDAEILWSYEMSPDGQHVLYRQVVDEHPAIYLMDFDGRSTNPLTEQPGINPAWSPDSQHITFTMLDQYNHSTQIYGINADGTAIKPLTNLPDDLRPIASFWSPDGRQILFQVMASINKISLHIMDADGSEAHLMSIPLLFDAFMYPAWSPDGRYIAFVGESVNSAQAISTTLCFMEVATAAAHCSDSNIYDQVSWSPDSTTIAFVAMKGYSTYEIKILDVRTAQTRPIVRYGETEPVLSVRYPVWTPDGQSLIYEVSTKGRDHGTQLHMVNIDGSGERMLTSGSFTNISPTWWIVP